MHYPCFYTCKIGLQCGLEMFGGEPKDANGTIFISEESSSTCTLIALWLKLVILVYTNGTILWIWYVNSAPIRISVKPCHKSSRHSLLMLNFKIAVEVLSFWT